MPRVFQKAEPFVTFDILLTSPVSGRTVRYLRRSAGELCNGALYLSYLKEYCFRLETTLCTLANYILHFKSSNFELLFPDP